MLSGNVTLEQRLKQSMLLSHFSHEFFPQQWSPWSAHMFLWWQDFNPNSIPIGVILIHKSFTVNMATVEEARAEAGRWLSPQKAVSFYLYVLKFSSSWSWDEEGEGRLGCFWFPWMKHEVMREVTCLSKDLSYGIWELSICCPEGKQCWENSCQCRRTLLWSRDIVYLVEYLFNIYEMLGPIPCPS